VQNQRTSTNENLAVFGKINGCRSKMLKPDCGRTIFCAIPYEAYVCALSGSTSSIPNDRRPGFLWGSGSSDCRKRSIPATRIHALSKLRRPDLSMPAGRPFLLCQNLDNHTRTHGAPALPDREAQAFVHGDGRFRQ